MTTLAPVVIRQLECKDAKWCNPLMCEFGRYEKDCPVVCGHPKCQDNEHTAPEPAKLEQCKDSATGNCAAIAKFCNHPIHGQSIGQMCPATCGVCNGGAFKQVQPVEECKDIQDNCESVKSYCNNEISKSMMRLECKKTCGFCGAHDSFVETTTTTTITTTTTTLATTTTQAASTCEDKHKDCFKMKAYCNHPQHADRVKGMCPKTCKACPSTTTTTKQVRTTTTATTTTASSEECKDRTPKYCQTYKRVCNKPAYQKTMKFKCQKTCGFCSSTGQAATTTNKTTTTSPEEKFGAWSAWSKCRGKKQYQKRKCLITPCPQRQLYKVQKC